MKKFLASALMLLAASTTTFAQNAVGSFSLQPKAGISIADILTSSSCHPKILVKEFSYFLMPCHQHGLGVNLLVQR